MHAGIRIFDPMLFEDTVVSKITENFNTKCYVMKNEEKLFNKKQSLETLFLLMKKTRTKKFKVIIYKICSGGLLSGGFWLGGFFRGVYVWGFFVLSPPDYTPYVYIIEA